jgi:hypothetical protein
VLARPGDLLGLTQLEQQVELFREQLIVVTQIVAEERE